MNGPLLLVRATVGFARFGFALWTRALGRKRARLLFWGGMGLSAVVAVVLQLAGV